MGLTVTNVNSIKLLGILSQLSNEQSTTLERLSTGFKINNAKDNPAGLIAMRSLDSALTRTNAALSNNQRTNALLDVATSALDEVASLLTQIEELAVASANEDGISADELAANQSQVDEAISAIDKIIQTTEFNGKKLLDGSLGIIVSGVDTSKITDVQVFRRESNSTSTSITVEVTGAASQAQVTAANTSASSDTTIIVQGKDGSATIEVAAGENLSSVAAKIDAANAQTGVDAFESGGKLYLRSDDYGEDAFVRVSVISGDTTNFLNAEDYGTDASVTVNGQSAAVDGLDVNYSANGTSISFKLSSTFTSGSETFTINGGGATFQLGTESNTRETIGISGLFTAQLGSASTGYLASLAGGGANNLIDNPNQAVKIVREAIKQVAKVQARLGAFQKFQVETAINQQTATKESLSSAISVVRDADYAEETANLNRQNVLLQSSISLLGLSNQRTSQILALLR